MELTLREPRKTESALQLSPAPQRKLGLEVVTSPLHPKNENGGKMRNRQCESFSTNQMPVCCAVATRSITMRTEATMRTSHSQVQIDTTTSSQATLLNLTLAIVDEEYRRRNEWE